jgi:hypothetical protein
MHARYTLALALVPLVALLSACGAEVPAVTDLGSHTVTLSPGTGTALTVQVPRAGTLEASARWANTETDLDLYWTDASCPSVDDLIWGGCTVLAQGNGRGPLNETAVAYPGAAGQYKVFVLALGAEGDSGTVALVLRR